MDNKNRKSGTGNITRGILPLAAGALGAGFLNGLLGAGAGIVLYFVLAAAGSRDAKENLVLSSTSVMFFCVISLFFYRDNAGSPWRAFCVWAFPPRSAACAVRIC